MAQRGRKSADSLQVVTPGNVSSLARPEPPSDLTPEQADEWWAVVERMPADWFPRETHGLLTQYCRHVVTARRVAQLVQSEEGAEDLDITRLDQLYKMQEREGRALSSLATRMRISQQALVDKRTDKPGRTAKKPWES